MLDACTKVLKGPPFEAAGVDSPLLEDFSKKISALKDLDATTRDRLLAEEKKALLDSFQPAYRKLIAYLQGLEKKANDDAGVWKFPDGGAFYAYALRRTTTTNLSADQIHEIGLKEVARIQDEMRKIMDKVGFKGDLQAFFKFMREDQQFYLPDTDEGRQKYLARAVEIIADMKARLDELVHYQTESRHRGEGRGEIPREVRGESILPTARTRRFTAGHVLRESGRNEGHAHV